MVLATPQEGPLLQVHADTESKESVAVDVAELFMSASSASADIDSHKEKQLDYLKKQNKKTASSRNSTVECRDP